jgi:SAM-dependent methyltransferase
MNKFLSHNWLAHEINRKCTLSVLKYVKGDLLDVGCGEKPYFEILKPHVNDYVGLDMPNTLHAKDKINIYGNACYLPFKDSSFNTVVSFQVMEHVNEPNQTVAGIYRVLKKGGYAVLTTPFMWGLHEKPRDFYRYTKYGLKYLFEKNGFEIVELRANSGYWIMAGLRFNYYLARFGRGYLKYLLSPIYFGVQVLSNVLDKIDNVETDTVSYTLVAKKI